MIDFKMEEEKEKREEFVNKFGPILRKVLDKQKSNVQEITFGCIIPSDYEAGEMIAQKIIENNLV